MSTLVGMGEVLFDDSTGEEQNQYLTFRLGGECFGVGILCVKEIIEYNTVTTVPMMPEFVHGVLNLRGRVVPVIDLAQRFGKGGTSISRRTCVIIVELGRDQQGGEDIGILVDGVNQVIEIPPERIAPAPAFGAKVRSDFIAGMAEMEGRFVILLNVDRVLSVEEMSLVAQTGQAGGLQVSQENASF